MTAGTHNGRLLAESVRYPIEAAGGYEVTEQVISPQLPTFLA